MINDKPQRGEQELWRANTYQLLARLLLKPPNNRLVAQLAEIPPANPVMGEDAVALAWCALGEAARRTQEPGLLKEYYYLFGECGGILYPRASRYMDSILNTNPLVLLRTELAGLGIENSGKLIEDHAGNLCEIMCQLIEAEDPRQIGFFSRHLKPWLPAFFRELKLTPSAVFYRPVGSLGEAFIEVERIFLRDTY